ncbi:MAG: hypothetical protein JJT94_11730, partial [Bernardetiaceae bacterium]|nr:hypothetical protein [Bernardetiaceae bacterium]
MQFYDTLHILRQEKEVFLRSVGDWEKLELELIAEQTGYVRASVSSQSAIPSYTDDLKFAVLPVAKSEILQEN